MSYHPDAPKRPGSAGLLYGVGGANAIKKILPVARAFVNVLDKEWLYMGDYRIEEVEHLTLAEWRTVPLRVRSNPLIFNLGSPLMYILGQAEVGRRDMHRDMGEALSRTDCSAQNI